MTGKRKRIWAILFMMRLQDIMTETLRAESQ